MSQFSRLMASSAFGLQDPLNGSDPQLNPLEIQTAPTLLDLQRMQRAPPKVIQQTEKSLETTDLTMKHIAGGYSREIFFRKNWKETMSELKHFIDLQNSESLTAASSIWFHEWTESR
jgi:hypothetical protein